VALDWKRLEVDQRAAEERAALAVGVPMLVIGVLTGVVLLALDETDKMSISVLNIIFGAFALGAWGYVRRRRRRDADGGR